MREVRDANSRIMFAEVIRTYQVGAFRSALVSLWITVVVDLTAKVRALGETGDGEARERVQWLDSAIENNDVNKVQDFERNLIGRAKKFEILTTREAVELKRLYEDRHLCAHPSFMGQNSLFSPEAELVRSHIVSAFEAVLSQPPIAGKQRRDLLKSELTQDVWPIEDKKELGDYLQKRFFGQARRSVQKNMMKILVKHSVSTPNEDKKLAKRASKAVQALAEYHPSLVEEAFGEVLNSWEESGSFSNERLYRCVGVFGSYRFCWENFPSTAYARLLALLKEPEINPLVENEFFGSGDPTHGRAAGMTDSSFIKMYTEALDELLLEHFEIVINETSNRSSFAHRLAEKLGSCVGFRNAEVWSKLLAQCAEGIDEYVLNLLVEKAAINDQVVYASGVEQHLVNAFYKSSDNELKRAGWTTLAERMRKTGSLKTFGHDYEYENLNNIVNSPF